MKKIKAMMESGYTVKEIAMNTTRKGLELGKKHGFAIVSGIAAGLAIGAKIKHKKEKGVPENYEADASNILKKCDWIEVAQ